MLRIAVGLAILAILAGIFGFGGISESFATIAKVVFFIAIALLAINLITGGFKRSS